MLFLLCICHYIWLLFMLYLLYMLRNKRFNQNSQNLNQFKKVFTIILHFATILCISNSIFMNAYMVSQLLFYA